MLRAAAIALLTLYSVFGQPSSVRTPEDAARAEQSLAANADDVSLRTDLCTWYYRAALAPNADPQMARRWRDNVLWLVEYHPEAAILGRPEGMIQHSGDRRASASDHAKARALWKRHVTASDAPAAVLAHAGYWLRLTDREAGATLLSRALRLAPGETAYSEALGLLYAEAALGVTEERSEYMPEKAERAVAESAFAKHVRSALEASSDVALLRAAGKYSGLAGRFAKSAGRLQYDPDAFSEKLLLRARRLDPGDDNTLETLAFCYSLQAKNARDTAVRVSAGRKWLEVSADRLQRAEPRRRARLLAEAAKAAYFAGELDVSSEYARKAMAAAQDVRPAEAGDVLHGANTVLGLVAAGRGDLRAAAGFLEASAKVPATPVLSSFGPSTMLAKTLFARGEREPVLEYLRLCAAFWESGTDDLKQWTTEVQAGRMPDRWRFDVLR